MYELPSLAGAKGAECAGAIRLFAIALAVSQNPINSVIPRFARAFPFRTIATAMFRWLYINKVNHNPPCFTAF